MLTDEIKEKYRDLTGEWEELTQKELRLMPYVQYVAMNDRKIDYMKIDLDEHNILNFWIDKKWIGFDTEDKIWISKKFWNVISEILYMSYVEGDN